MDSAQCILVRDSLSVAVVSSKVAGLRFAVVSQWDSLTGFRRCACFLIQATLDLRHDINTDHWRSGLRPCTSSLADPSSPCQTCGDFNCRFLFLGASHDIKILSPASLVRWVALGNACKL